MFNLMRGELYKWKKSKAFWGCLIAAVAMMTFTYLMLIFAQMVQTGQVENGTMGVTVSGESVSEEDADILEEVGIKGMVQTCTTGGFSVIFTAIFICIWIVGEYTNGAVKNIVGKGYSRNSIFLARFLSSVVIATVMNLLIFAVTLLLGFAIMGTEQVNAGFWRDMLSYIGIEVMLSIALSGVIVTICEVTRNMAAGISISIALAIFSSVIGNGLDLFFKAIHVDFTASIYWITNAMAECPLEGLDMNFVGRAIYVAVLWTALSLFWGMIHFHETDI